MSTVLRLYRGVAYTNEEALSIGLKEEMIKKLRKFILEADIKDATQWLSICDTALRSKDMEMVKIASDKIQQLFDFDSLLTNTKSETKQSAGGRKVRRE